MKDEFKPLLLAVGALLTQLGSPNAAQAAQTPEPLASQPSAVATPQGVRAVAPLQTAQTGVRPLFLPQPVQVQPGQLQVQPGVLQGLPQASHVNSGPTGHANTGGHANFSREQFQGQFRDPRVNPGGFAGSHANSGPTGHANVPGHANFNQQINPGAIINPQFAPQVNPGVFQGAHVNSGPTGHANTGGHANFNQQINPQVNPGLILRR